MNSLGFQMDVNAWSCSGAWTHAELFERLARSDETAPVALYEDFFECQKDESSAVIEAFGSVGAEVPT